MKPTPCVLMAGGTEIRQLEKYPSIDLLNSEVFQVRVRGSGLGVGVR